jgi:hypothetical protein
MVACTHVNVDSVFIQIHKSIIQILEDCVICRVTRYGLDDRMDGWRGFFLRRLSGRIPTLTRYLHILVKAKKDELYLQ